MQSVVIQQHRIATAQGELFAQSRTPAEQRGAPIVLLHDSQGCVGLWRDFPA